VVMVTTTTAAARWWHSLGKEVQGGYLLLLSSGYLGDVMIPLVQSLILIVAYAWVFLLVAEHQGQISGGRSDD